MKLKFITLLAILLHINAAAIFAGNDTIAASKAHYRTAMKELDNMLSGSAPLSYERAVYLIENAYNDNRIDPAIFTSVLDYHTGIIREIAVSNTAKPKEIKSESFWDDLRKYRNEENGYATKAKMNWAIFSFMTDTALHLKRDNINYIIHKEPLKYSKQDPLGTIDWANTQVTHLIEHGNGNCFALAALFKIYSERLQSDADICTAPGHIFITHRDDKGTYYNVELSNGTFPGIGTLETLTYTTDEAVKKGIAMRQLNLKQSVALCLVYLAKGYEYKFKTKGDEFALECAELALKYDTLNLNAMLLKAEVLETKIINQNKPVAELQADKTFIAYESLIRKMYQSGYREMPLEMKNILIKGWTRDTTVIATKLHTPKTFNHLGVSYNRYASLSWGLFDEDIENKPLERYSRTIYDTRENRITKFAKEEVLYNDYNFDPVVFAWNVDPMAHKLPGWSPYAFCVDNPIVYFDPDGQYPIYVITRSYAPFKTFGPGNNWYGDNRGMSLSKDASYRTSATINYDTETMKTQVSGGRSYSHTVDGTKKAWSQTRVRDRSNGPNIDVHSAGNNAAQRGSWDIDQFTKIKVTTQGDIKKDHILNIKGTISGDNFPNQESFVYDAKGNALWLGNFATSKGPVQGPTLNLMGKDENDVQINIDAQIKVNSEGIFQGVIQGDKMIPINDWNKKFE